MSNTISRISSVLVRLEKARPLFAQAQSEAIDGALDTMTAIKANLEQSTEPRDLPVLLSWEVAKETFAKSDYSKENRLDAAIQYVGLVVEALQTGMIPGAIGRGLSPGLINAEGVDPSGSLPVPKYPEYKEAFGQQLIKAFWGNQIEQALNLVDRGADVLAKDSDGRTCLHSAALCGYTEFALAVLNRIPLPEQRQLLFEKTKDGETWLHDAAVYGHTEFALAVLDSMTPAEQRQLLFEKTKNKSWWPGNRKTAAHVARQHNQPKMAEALEKLASKLAHLDH